MTNRWAVGNQTTDFDRHKEERHTMAETMTRGQIQDLVGKFASENPKSARLC